MTPKKETDVARGLGSGVDAPTGQKGLHLRGETKSAAIVRVVQWFNPEGIASEKKAPFTDVPNGEREHSAKICQHGWALPFVEVQQNFGVAPGSEFAALACKPVT